MFQGIFKGVGMVFQGILIFLGCFMLVFRVLKGSFVFFFCCCCIAVIAATRTEGGLVRWSEKC